MNYIENEFEFTNFMERYGPKDSESRKSYLSRLNYLAKNGFKIDSTILQKKSIIDELKQTARNRTEYNRNSDYPSLGSAITKYHSFLKSNPTIFDDIQEIRNQTQLTQTQKKQFINARLGQGKFRNQLISLWGKCSVSGIENIDFLIASHILPWRKSTDIEKLDPYNGLLLQPNIDKLFDKGFISFQNDGQVILSKKIHKAIFKSLGISERSKLRMVHVQNIRYLELHRDLFHKILFNLS